MTFEITTEIETADPMMLELAGMLMEEVNHDPDIGAALAATMRRFGFTKLGEFVEQRPADFKVFAHAVLGMVDQVPYRSGSKDRELR